MNRRQALQTAFAATAWGGVLADAVHAQPLARVGWLEFNSQGRYAEVTSRGFIKGLREAGFEEGRNLAFERRSAENDLRRLRALARDLVAAKVDVMFAPAKPMADAAWYASRRIPTVIATVTDPVITDYAVSLGRPGKHITGVTTANAELIGKRMQLLKEMVPGLKRVGTLIDPDFFEACGEELRLMHQAAAVLGLELVRIPVRVDGVGFDDDIRRILAAKVQAMITAPMTSNLDVTDKLAIAMRKVRLPFMHDIPQLADEGLAVYGPDFEDIFRRAGHYVARILKGEKPAEMAIEEPREFRFIVNLKTAKALGLTIPYAVLLRADEVIE
jgi:putative tryptophan/tyrosine transport system substrate-binding protein